MSLMPLAEDATYDYVPESFKEKDNTGQYIVPEAAWPTFQLRALTNKEHAQLRRSVLLSGKMDMAKPEKVVEASEMVYEAVRKTITGWKGIVNVATGEEYSYRQDPEGGADKGLWERIPDSIKAELFQHVCRMAGLVKVSGDDRMEMAARGL